jgi:hypothetical protein
MAGLILPTLRNRCCCCCGARARAARVSGAGEVAPAPAPAASVPGDTSGIWVLSVPYRANLTCLSRYRGPFAELNSDAQCWLPLRPGESLRIDQLQGAGHVLYVG